MSSNQKVVNTERKIKSAFIYLTETKGIKAMTVSDITKFARINRSTFYTHYRDKTAMVSDFEDQILTHIEKLVLDHSDEKIGYQDVSEGTPHVCAAVETVVDYLNQEFNMSRALLGPGGDSQLEVKIRKLLGRLIDRQLVEVKGQTGPTKIPDNFAREIIVSGLMSIIKVWLTEGNPETPKEISTIIMKTRYLSPFDLLDVKKA
ncbi:MAG: TetR-like C-terminal domain-containing protein [Lentilactobacillus hilgardii]|jgi:AcrR family transcriptional regulator|uniref:TetR/AcrR family transcriptional regulator n=1 Tax=Lentilactobacillus hilgardii TaxID=1588 RepID=UPI001CC1FF35|nr:TetR/AcrR family transcriptional regulator [Lentilactobacillus hilgardii]MCI2020038.1 TetR/AcrR family transcriptional regulator [Lentilactobacillus buchneri]MBZ2200211.1 transcriptional regulator [Lentilactobacillus hilgardii]MBZ2203252.1 transcriptional regulator [Lentilactobacillus hilgardii]MCT3399975.1 TetR/AcrR family transcriptional regulator [Lentilactobacillus hilgardii]MCV3740961.1 TetR/AcrR family transcriptional regulator [Lentilactobacillus hilgardii]